MSLAAIMMMFSKSFHHILWEVKSLPNFMEIISVDSSRTFPSGYELSQNRKLVHATLTLLLFRLNIQGSADGWRDSILKEFRKGFLPVEHGNHCLRLTRIPS